MSKPIDHILPAGTLLHGRYRIQSHIGQGGFGITYKAEDERLGTRVCIKELFLSGHCTRGAGNKVYTQGLKDLNFADFRSRFEREARRLARFKNPGIVEVRDVFEEHDTAYYVMEFIEGDSLAALLKRKGRLSLQEAMDIFMLLLDAVELLHEANPPLLHRDIKPSNIMLRKAQPVLIDFGSARELIKNASRLQAIDLEYSAPELFDDEDREGLYSDIYSLGGVLYAMLSGKAPVSAIKRLNTELPTPTSLNPAVPAPISAVIMKAMAMKTGERYQSVAELRAAFQVHRSNPLQEARQELKALNDQTQRADNLPGLAAEAEKLLQRHEAEQGADWEAWRKEARAFAYTSQRAAADSAFSRKRFAEAKQYYERALLQKPDCTHSRSRLEAIAAMEAEAPLPNPTKWKRPLLVAGGLLVIILLIWFFRYNGNKNNSAANPAASADATMLAGNETARESDSLAYPIAKATDKTVQQAVTAGKVKSAPATAPEQNQPTQGEKEMQRKEAIIRNLQNNMVFVQGGTFTMGCTAEQGSDCDNDEKPAHQVTLNSFKIGKYEVTQEEWEAVMGNNPSYFKNCPKCPVENISWNDVQVFLQKLNTITRGNYRLPTEAEWEYAARGGSRQSNYIYSGSNEVDNVAWEAGNSNDRTHSVGTKLPNDLGLFDMSGNVYEWCDDWYGKYSNNDQVNPPNPRGTEKVLRGGSWYETGDFCRVSSRAYNFPSVRDDGFRLVSPSS